MRNIFNYCLILFLFAMQIGCVNYSGLGKKAETNLAKNGQFFYVKTNRPADTTLANELKYSERKGTFNIDGKTYGESDIEAFQIRSGLYIKSKMPGYAAYYVRVYTGKKVDLYYASVSTDTYVNMERRSSTSTTFLAFDKSKNGQRTIVSPNSLKEIVEEDEASVKLVDKLFLVGKKVPTNSYDKVVKVLELYNSKN